MKIPYKNGLLSMVTLLFILTFCSQGLGQNQEKQFWDHVRFGGGIGLSIGDGFFGATLAPSAIYQLNDQFAFGLGLNGTYNKQKDVYTSSIIGANVIALFNVLPQVQVSGEFEELNVVRKFERELGIENDNYWYPALFLGLGYTNGNFTFGLKYDVLYDQQKSVYSDAYIPFVRIFF